MQIYERIVTRRKTKMDKKYVYLFQEGNADMRELLGGKGANLAEMTKSWNANSTEVLQ